jgi:hypothetical protein
MHSLARRFEENAAHIMPQAPMARLILAGITVSFMTNIPALVEISGFAGKSNSAK